MLGVGDTDLLAFLRDLVGGAPEGAQRDLASLSEEIAHLDREAQLSRVFELARRRGLSTRTSIRHGGLSPLNSIRSPTRRLQFGSLALKPWIWQNANGYFCVKRLSGQNEYNLPEPQAGYRAKRRMPAGASGRRLAKCT